MSGIFINYSREDTSGYAGRLFRDLAEHFGHDRVFMDIDTLQPGIDFVDAINTAVETADVVLVLIGSHWLSITDAGGTRRIENPDDFVRMEVAAALAGDTRVIPVLVGNASMPPSIQLPEDIKPLARRHAYEISDRRWDFDVKQLIDVLSPIVNPPTIHPTDNIKEEVTSLTTQASAEVPADVSPTRNNLRARTAIGLFMVVSVVLAIGFRIYMQEGNEGDNDEDPNDIGVVIQSSETEPAQTEAANSAQDMPRTATASTPVSSANTGALSPAGPAESQTTGDTTADQPVTGDTNEPFSIGDTVVANEDGVNVRPAANLSGDPVTILGLGDQLTLLNGPIKAEGYTWWEVILPNGDVGWIVEEFIERP